MSNIGYTSRSQRRRFTVYRKTLAAIVAALTLTGTAAAASLSAGAVSATGSSSSSVELSWSLGSGEYACALYMGTGPDPTATPFLRRDLSPSATSWAGGGDMTPGTTWRAVLTTAADAACAGPRTYSNIVELPIPAWVDPAPPVVEQPVATPPAAPTGPTIEERLAELEARLAAIEERLTLLEELTAGTGNVSEALRIVNVIEGS